MRFIFDTQIYDYILDNNVDSQVIDKCGTLYITNVQLSEIKNIPDTNKRSKLLNLIENLQPNKLNLDSGIWLDDLYWDDSQPWVDETGEAFKALLGNSQNKRPFKDALIGEVAKNHNLLLITNDKNFSNKAVLLGIKTMTIEDFLGV